jgi:hypothetical protein
MQWVSVTIGAILIVLGLHEVFHTVLHPAGRARLTTVLVNAAWWLTGRRRESRPFAGPIAMVAAFVLWATLQVVGWALVYLPFVPEGFAYGSGVPEGEHPAILEALYFSTVILATLGLGDMVPTTLGIRLLAPVQAVVGFGLLTAYVSWFMQIYPGLGRRRSLALRLAVLDEASYRQGLPDMNPVAATQTLHGLAADLAQVRVDLTQNAESYYFSESDPQISLAAQVPGALRLARTARQSPHAELRASGEVLETAVDDFAGLLRQQFLDDDGTTDDLLRGYAEEHRQA